MPEKYLVLDYQDSVLSPELKAEIKELADDFDLQQNNFMWFDHSDEDDEEFYPLLCEYLDNNSVDKVLILYWW